MKARGRTLVSALLFGTAAVFLGLVALLLAWGGRIEVTFLVFGDPVFVAIDAGRPRILLLFAPPIVLIGGAFYVRAASERKRDSSSRRPVSS